MNQVKHLPVSSIINQTFLEGNEMTYTNRKFTAYEKTAILKEYLFIPGNEEHQIRNVGESPLVFVFLIPAGVAEL